MGRFLVAGLSVFVLFFYGCGDSGEEQWRPCASAFETRGRETEKIVNILKNEGEFDGDKYVLERKVELGDLRAEYYLVRDFGIGEGECLHFLIESEGGSITTWDHYVDGVCDACGLKGRGRWESYSDFERQVGEWLEGEKVY